MVLDRMERCVCPTYRYSFFVHCAYSIGSISDYSDAAMVSIRYFTDQYGYNKPQSKNGIAHKSENAAPQLAVQPNNSRMKFTAFALLFSSTVDARLFQPRGLAVGDGTCMEDNYFIGTGQTGLQCTAKE